jgi:glycerate 2-kinase
MTARSDLMAIFGAALDAVEPYRATRRFLTRDGNRLRVGARPPATFDLGRIERVTVLGAGKAAAPMARGVEDTLGDRLTGGTVVVKYGHALPLQRLTCREAGHPVPDENGLRAGEEILALARSATEQELVICLLSGGGSALLEAPHAPLTLADLQATTAALLASGATIVEVNRVRRHLSRLKGGRLAATVAPASLVTLVLSDVIGSPLTAIASGPTGADDSTWRDVQDIVERYGLAPRLPGAVVALVRDGAAGRVPETPAELPRAPVVVIGDNGMAAEAGERAAKALGYSTRIVSRTLEGEARVVGRTLARHARRVQGRMGNGAAARCLVYGGETTVTLGERAGTGGRNQELALAAALEIEGREGITLGAFATDGTDGPTDSAGAIVDGATVERGGGRAAARAHLDAHDAYPFLEACGDLVRTGPTRTNVNDLIVLLVEPSRPTARG